MGADWAELGAKFLVWIAGGGAVTIITAVLWIIIATAKRKAKEGNKFIETLEAVQNKKIADRIKVILDKEFYDKIKQWQEASDARIEAAMNRLSAKVDKIDEGFEVVATNIGAQRHLPRAAKQKIAEIHSEVVGVVQELSLTEQVKEIEAERVRIPELY